MKLIVIDGGDGCGKATQAKKLYESLKEENYNVHLISFPDYESDYSVFVKSYLDGTFGENGAINPKIASLFFAMDRYAAFQTKYNSLLDQEDAILICDRYTTSNELYQVVRYEKATAQDQFLQWLENFEYRLLELPKPDLLIMLRLPIRIRLNLLAERTGKTGGNTGDIHENDIEYLKKVDHAYQKISSRYSAITINCADHKVIRDIDVIAKEVLKKVKECGVLYEQP
jgi:dTMP kinase